MAGSSAHGDEFCDSIKDGKTFPSTWPAVRLSKKTLFCTARNNSRRNVTLILAHNLRDGTMNNGRNLTS